MAVSLVQTKTGNAGNYLNSNVQTLNSPVTASSLLVLFVVAGSLDSVASVTDSRGNVWNSVRSDTNGERALSVFYVKKAAAGSTTVTVTFGTGQYPDSVVMIREYSGLDGTAPLDVTASGNDGTSYGNTVHSTAASAVTSQANELVVVGVGASAPSPGWMAGTGYSRLDTNNGYDQYTSGAIEDKVVTSTGSQTGTFITPGGVRAVVTLVTFRVAGTANGNIKAYVGGSFIAKPVKVWNGSSWVVKPVKRWSGTAWVPTNY